MLEEEALEVIGVNRKHEPSRLRRGYPHDNYEQDLETKIGILTIRRQKVSVTAGSERYSILWIEGMSSAMPNKGKNVLLLVYRENSEGSQELIDYRVADSENEAGFIQKFSYIVSHH